MMQLIIKLLLVVPVIVNGAAEDNYIQMILMDCYSNEISNTMDQFICLKNHISLRLISGSNDLGFLQLVRLHVGLSRLSKDHKLSPDQKQMIQNQLSHLLTKLSEPNSDVGKFRAKRSPVGYGRRFRPSAALTDPRTLRRRFRPSVALTDPRTLRRRFRPSVALTDPRTLSNRLRYRFPTNLLQGRRYK